MQIKIKDQLLELNNAEVRLAKKHFSRLLEEIHILSKESGRPSYYYTFLIISYVLSQDLLDMCDEEMLKLFFKAAKE